MRRVLRIYPAFLAATLLVSGALALASMAQGNAAASSWFNQFYHETLNWRIIRENLLFQSASLNCVTWTLGVEMAGSVFLGFAHFLTRGWPLGGRGILLGGLMALAWWFPQGQLLPYLFMFWLGYLLPQIGPWLSARFKAHRLWSFGLLLLAVTIFLRAHQTRVELWAEPLGATLLLACLVWGRPFGLYRGLDHPVVRFYGRISYSFYLLHFPVLYALSLVALRLLPAETLLRWPNFAAIWLGATSVLAVTPLAWLTYVGVEKPGILQMARRPLEPAVGRPSRCRRRRNGLALKCGEQGYGERRVVGAKAFRALPEPRVSSGGRRDGSPAGGVDRGAGAVWLGGDRADEPSSGQCEEPFGPLACGRGASGMGNGAAVPQGEPLATRAEFSHALSRALVAGAASAAARCAGGDE
jgi:peptidoglycan/LPS O-acetylase OafA/YrhL